jgi:hypothetical protein
VSDCPSPIIDDIGRIRYELELFLLGGAFDLYEDERMVAKVEPNNAVAEFSYGKLILSCWGPGWSRAWRIAKANLNPDCLLLYCLKQMGRVACSLVLRRGPAQGRMISRADFASRISAAIKSNFPRLSVERAVTARDDHHHFSSAHARLILSERGREVAAVAAGPDESQDDVDALLGAGLIWHDLLRNRHKTSRRGPDRLMIIAPAGRNSTLATRLTAMRDGPRDLALYEFDEAQRIIKSVAPFDQGDLNDHLRRCSARADWQQARACPPEAEALARSISQIAPDSIETHRRGRWLVFSINGLRFARLSMASNHLYFGINGEHRLTEKTKGALERLVDDIVARRRNDAAERNSAQYRSSPERWLESIVSRDATRIDPTIDPRFVYSQVPAYRGDHRSMIDILAVTREGRLVVIELKVAEDIEFPFQGLDYWLRVEWHRARNDFQRRGYFDGINLMDAAPLLYLVAPLFRFHATTNLLAGSITKRVPVFRVGINEDWRGGLRVLLSERLN